MASLLEIRKKIGGVKSTKKITKAMQLVATSKMKMFQKKAVSAREYIWDLLKVLEQNLNDELKNLYTEQRKEGATLFVIYTSDKGLCGALNNNLLKGLFRSEKWMNTPKEDRLLITIGKKSNEFARSNQIEVEKHFLGIPEKLGNTVTLEVIDTILKLWTDRRCKEIIFIAPHFQNTFTFYPVLKTFLPFSKEMVKENIGRASRAVESEKDASSSYMLYEPDKKMVLEKLFRLIVQGLFVQSFFELKASEYSSRMIAMQNATEAADKKIVDLTRTYNKTRQQVITQQLAELIGASDVV
ncbi:MAG: ATP synthase F1 subunit gamma [Candidatus Altimarinota bacterium]